MSPLVQEISGTTTGTTLTLTFGTPVTAGNAVIIALAGYFGGSVSTVTIGGVSSGFAKVATSTGYNAEIWAAYSAAASSATLVITSTQAGIAGWAYEVSGLVTLDQATGTHSSGTSWNSGTTAASIPYYQHFAVGLGAVFGSSASVTATGSGWTNETAYSGIAGADTFGGVSGYQQPSGSGTYAYSGTASASTAWGSVTAVFLATPKPAVILTNWSGYQFTEHASYTGVSATFSLPVTMPAVAKSTALASVWVGMGNVNQVGVYLAYDASAVNGVYTSPWSWWIVGAGEIWDETAYPAQSGDSLTLSMTLSAADWVMTMTNNTQSWSYTETMSVQATNVNSWNTLGTTPFGVTTPAWIYPVPTAEVIIEKELQTPDYGSITFTSITTVPPISGAPMPIFTLGSGDICQYPGPFTATGGTGTFTEYWNSAS